MFRSAEAIRVLYSFPLRIGASGVCMAAWSHVNALAQAGAHVLLHPASVQRALPAAVAVVPTLAWGMARVPYRAIGLRRAMGWHDHVVAGRLPALVEDVDIVHAWPGGAEETLTTARQLSLPSVLERPNAHTRHAFEIVRREADRLGVTLPPGHNHAYNERVLRREEHEFELADQLLCPSPFVANTFIEEGFATERLAPHTYGYDEAVFYADRAARDPSRPLQALFVGADALRKGLHYALEAWLRSPARERGTFRVLGELTPGYDKKLAPMLAHPSVEFLGLRSDYPELLRCSDVLLLPTLEEGSPMVCVDALASGCVPLVSEICAGVCEHLDNALVHPVGDVDLLVEHLTMLHDDADLLERLREGALRSAPQYTWQASGARLLDVYRGLLART